MQAHNRLNSKDNTYCMLRVLTKANAGLKICHLNAQSLKPKLDEFRYFFEGSNVDIVCISETWFDENNKDFVYGVNGYNLFKCDRKSYAGGVAMYIKSGIEAKVIFKNQESRDIQYLFVEIHSDNQKLLIGTVYRRNRAVNLDDFYDKLRETSMPYEEIILAGDFNSDILKEDCLTSNMATFGLYTTNTAVPTHYTNTVSTLLDLFFVSNRINVIKYDQISAPTFSKHDLIFLAYDFKTINEPYNEKFRDFRHIGYRSLLESFNLLNLDRIYHMTSVEDQVRFLQDNIRDLYNNFVALKIKLLPQLKSHG